MGHALRVGRAAPVPREVTLGVRPSDLALAAEGMPARLERIEDLGDSAIVSVMSGERLLKLKTARAPDLAEGETVHVGFAPESAHLFDATSGQRL
jgi:ABC-type sugar transport system ATPase subunit